MDQAGEYLKDVCSRDLFFYIKKFVDTFSKVRLKALYVPLDFYQTRS
jgi:hypothetical protein